MGVCDAGDGGAGGCRGFGVWAGYVGSGSGEDLCHHEGMLEFERVGGERVCVCADIGQIVYFNQLSYFVSATFSKLCFLFMFLRIFPAERTRKAVYIGVVLSILFPIAFGLPMTFACRPISGTFTRYSKFYGGGC